jgi:hypothetical protein
VEVPLHHGLPRLVGVRYHHEQACRGTGADPRPNGRILAIQNRLDSVEAWIPYVSDPDETAKLLAEILAVDYTALRSDFGAKNASMWIKRKISPRRASGFGLCSPKAS